MSLSPPAAAALPATVEKSAPVRALAGWVLVDWALQPYYTLVLTFLFAPYFTSTVVDDPVRGQALWGYAAAVAGVLIAVGSPLLGALADGGGRRKPWVALFASILAAGLGTLWWAEPGAETATVLLVLAAFVAATMAAEFATVFTNAIMPTLVPPSRLGRLSGIGWATGYVGGLVSIAVVAGLLVTNPATGRTLLGLEPLLALDTAQREGDRLVGPFAAAWLLAFLIPFFLFVPDRRPTDVPLVRKPALTGLAETLRALPGQRDMLWFLIARALYTDGLSAIFVFGGIYGTAVFEWQSFERGVFGIVLITVGVAGAVLGGALDDRFGAKRVVMGALVLLMAGCLGILSVSSGHVLFTVPVDAKAPGSQPFSSPGELVFLAFACLVAIAAAPNQAASRTLLARLAPPERMTQFFGLFAFSGKVTAFLAPLSIAAVTAFSGSLRAGMAMILVFLLAGFVGMLPVREKRLARAGYGN
ncbi:MAG: MFS transporter [Hyphomicrobiaceae bacterium]|nr:MFS transporter [Hyphomicrobiaceae bacterium]